MCWTAFLPPRSIGHAQSRKGGLKTSPPINLRGAFILCPTFFEITFRTGNIPMNLLLVLMIVVMILLVYLKHHGGW
jgi:hypothetical protein